jgi:hypothetical protein
MPWLAAAGLRRTRISEKGAPRNGLRGTLGAIRRAMDKINSGLRFWPRMFYFAQRRLLQARNAEYAQDPDRGR